MVGWVGLNFNPKLDQLKQMNMPALWRKGSNSNKNSLYCSFCYLFDTIHFFFLLRKKTPMMNIPNKPKTTGKMLASKFPISKIAAITIKIIPINSAIFGNIMLHMLIRSRTQIRLSLKRANLLSAGACYMF
jgi:hypothetical protein